MLTRIEDRTDFNQPNAIALQNNVFGALLRHLDFQGKKVLDVGCGWGGYGKRCAEWGASVTFIDGRQVNINEVIERVPNQYYICHDIMDSLWEPPKVDITLCVGLLYHVDDPLELLRKLSRTPILVVESICLDHDGVALIKVEEDTANIDYSLTGGACRPSPGWIVNALQEVGYTSITELLVAPVSVTEEWPGAVWNWDYQRTCGWRRNEHHLRKLFIAHKS